MNAFRLLPIVAVFLVLALAMSAKAEYGVYYFFPVNETIVSLLNVLPGGSSSSISSIFVNPLNGIIFILYSSPNGTGGFIELKPNGAVLRVVKLPGCSTPFAGAVDYANNTVYVSCPSLNTIYVVDASSGTLMGEIPVKYAPTWVAFSQSEQALYVIASGSGKVMRYGNGVVYLEEASNIPSLWPPVMLALNGASGLVYLAYGTGYVLYVNSSTWQIPEGYCTGCVLATTGGLSPTYVLYDRLNNVLFVATGSYTLAFNGTTGSIAFKIPYPASWLTIDPGLNGGILFMLDGDVIHVVRYLKDGYIDMGLIHLPAPASSILWFNKSLYAPIPSLYSVDILSFYSDPAYTYPVYIYVNVSEPYTLVLKGPVSGVFRENSSSVTLWLPNGLYSLYVELPPPYYTYPSNITFIVHYSSVKIIIPAYAYYVVKFVESGLALNFTWSVSIIGVNNRGLYVNETLTAHAGEGITAYLEPGDYTYMVTIPFGYSATPPTGRLAVSGPGSQTIDISYTLLTYPVVVSLNGLTPGAIAYLQVTGTTLGGGLVNQTLSLSVPKYTLTLPDGSYVLRVLGVDYGSYKAVEASVPGSIQFAVWGNSTSVNVTLTEAKYTLLVDISGVATGTRVAVSVGGSTYYGSRYSYSTTLEAPRTTLLLNLTDGSYTVSVASTQYGTYINPYLVVSRGIVINGAPQNVTLTLSPAQYDLIILLRKVLGIGPVDIRVVGVSFNNEVYNYRTSTLASAAVVALNDGEYVVAISGPWYLGSYVKRIMVNGGAVNITVTLIGIPLILIIAVVLAAAVAFIVLRRLGYV